MKLLIVAILVSGAVVKAQKPSPCEAPKEWECRMFQSMHKGDSVTRIMGKFSYDAVNERERIVGEVETAGKRSFFDVIILFKEKKMYTVSLDEKNTSTCSVSDHNEPFQPARIPDNTTFQSEAYIGTSAGPGAGVLVYIFGGKVSAASYMVSVTAEGCLPVDEEVSIEGKNLELVHTSYFDIVLGIEDPERFIPPSICDKMSDVVSNSPLNFLRHRQR